MEPVNLEQLNQFGDSPQEIRKLCALFFQQVGELVDALKKACAEHQAEPWRQTAHKLKGAAANLGAEALAKAAASAQHEPDAAQEGKEAIIAAIEQELALARSFLTERLGKF